MSPKRDAATAEAQPVGEAEEHDEFAPPEAGAVSDALSPYANAGGLGDADDVRPRRFIPDGTKVTLGLTDFSLNLKREGGEYIFLKVEVVAPEEWVGEDTQFGQSFNLKAQAPDPDRPHNTAWNVSRRQIARIVAAVYQKPLKDTSVDQFMGPAFMAAANITDPAAKKLAFFKALTALLNDELKGKTIEADIGIDPSRVYNGRTYKKRQSIGRPYYPNRREKDAD